MKKLLVLIFASLFLVQTVQSAGPSPKKSTSTSKSATQKRPVTKTVQAKPRTSNFKSMTKTQHKTLKAKNKLATSTQNVKRYKAESKHISKKLYYARITEKKLSQNYEKAKKKQTEILNKAGQNPLTNKQRLELKKYDAKGIGKKLRTATKNRANLELQLSTSQGHLKYHQSQKKQFTAQHKAAKKELRRERGGVWYKLKSKVKGYFTRSKPTTVAQAKKQPKPKAKGVTFSGYPPPGVDAKKGKVRNHDSVSVLLERLPMPQ